MIRGAHLINEGQTFMDVFIKNGLICQIGESLNVIADDIINAEKYLMPGVIMIKFI